MGLFDSLKSIASKSVSDALNSAKNAAEEQIKGEIKEKGSNVINEGINSYLDKAEKAVTTQDGKESVAMLKNLVQDREDIREAIANGESADDEVKKTQDDLNKISEFSNNYNK